MTYQCFLVDDEPIAIDILETYLGRLEGFTVAGRFTNPVQAFEALQRISVDLLFLDIQMPGLNGLDFLKALQRRPEVILTTAYREFALEGFEFDVVDYLLKPVPFERFLQAIAKFQNRIRKNETAVFPKISTATDEPAHLFVRADRKNVKVLLSEILYLESLKDYVRIVTVREKLVTKQSITNFEETLPPGRFLRVHRSYIVAKDQITAWSADGLEIGKVPIPVGRLYKQLVERALR